MLDYSKEHVCKEKNSERVLVYSFALVILLGFELSYYLLIVQTGVTQYLHSDLIELFPLFFGGVLGTYLAGKKYEFISSPIHKISLALSLQLILSFFYPHFNSFTLFLLGISVGAVAPLSVFIFKQKQILELVIGLGIAYTIGTYFFDSHVDSRTEMAIIFSLLALISTMVLKDYETKQVAEVRDVSSTIYLMPMLWIFLDSHLFESLLRNSALDIWSHNTGMIIAFHLFGLVSAYFMRSSHYKQHLIGILFLASYIFSYLGNLELLIIVYPFVISYYNVDVFSTLIKENNLYRLSIAMIFIAWFASGAGLALALTKILY